MMYIPPISLVAMTFSGISVVLALAMLFLVVWQAPRRRDNQLMALYLATVMTWGAASFTGRLAVVFGYDPTPFGLVVALAVAVNSWLLFALVAHYAGMWDRHWVRLGLVLGLAAYVVFVPMLLRGQLYHTIHITPEGMFNYQVEPAGYIAYAIIYSFYLAGLAVLWVYRQKRAGTLLAGSLLVSIGALTPLLPVLSQYPLDVIAAAFAGLFFTSAILRENLFNPLADLNRQLVESEKRLRTVITGAPIVLWATDRDGIITVLEGRGLDALGLKPGQLIGMSIFELYDDLPTLHDSARRALAGQEFTEVLETANRAYETQYIPMRTADGTLTGIVGLSIDMSERRQAERILRQNEEKYRTIIENIEDGYYEVDLAGSLMVCNDSFCRIIGYSRVEALGPIPWMWTDQPGVKELYKILQRVYETGAPHRAIETEIIRKDRSLRTIELSVSLVKNVQNEPIGFRGIARDITVRKQTEAELTQRMTELATLREIEAELTDTLDMNRRLPLALDIAVRLSRAHAGFIGLIEGELIRVVQLIGGYQDDMLGSYLPVDAYSIGRVLREQQAELVADVRADPDYFPHLRDTRALILIPLISQERTIGVVNLETSKPERFTEEVFEFLQLLVARVAVAIDNAQLYQQTQAQLEELREIYSDLSALEQLKTQMIRIASHDLRNPLSTMSGYLELLKTDIGSQLGPQQQEFMMAIERALARMHTITGEILSLERIEQTAHLSKTARIADLRALVEKAVAEHREQARLKSQNLLFDAPVVTAQVLGDEVQLYEAIANLLGNAIKYTPTGGRIEVSMLLNDRNVVFEVIDNGYGVPEDQQRQLFQPFFRAQSEETRTIEGTGLGLHLVKNIIESHKGSMIFHSVYGQGSTFGFELPVTNP
jgi:PAS domain S-box-containing protein